MFAFVVSLMRRITICHPLYFWQNHCATVVSSNKSCFWKDMDKEVILYYEALAQIQTLDTILTLTRQSLIYGFGHLTCLQFEVPAVLQSSLEYEFVLIYSNDTRFIASLFFWFLYLHEVKTFNSIYFILQRSV
jgi:hypothetical protein